MASLANSSEMGRLWTITARCEGSNFAVASVPFLKLDTLFVPAKFSLSLASSDNGINLTGAAFCDLPPREAPSYRKINTFRIKVLLEGESFGRFICNLEGILMVLATLVTPLFLGLHVLYSLEIEIMDETRLLGLRTFNRA